MGPWRPVLACGGSLNLTHHFKKPTPPTNPPPQRRKENKTCQLQSSSDSVLLVLVCVSPPPPPTNSVELLLTGFPFFFFARSSRSKILLHPLSPPLVPPLTIYLFTIQGRIGIQALKKYKALPGGGVAFRKQFYKGGFENRMTRQEAILVLQLRYASFLGSGVCARLG